jgi:hypothetical protein
MKKDRPSEAPAASGGSSPPEGHELYEMLVAELASRRERLNHLLGLVTLEVDRSLRSASSESGRLRCRPVPDRTALEG